MNISEILEKFGDYPATNKITSLLKQNNTKIKLSGIKGGSISLIAATITKRVLKNHVFIFNEKEEAAYFYNDLQKLLGEFEVEFLPSMFQRSVQYGKVDNGNILIRTEILGKISAADKPVILVTYTEGFMEKVISSEQLQSNTFPISKGDKLSMDFLIELFD